ncbi:hypothetical protein DL765_006341 [Monosporascus sp. GIB2]|nr:hypothetical protein DL765_006341 [Monosporascus sp. GIB2]
MDHQKNDRPLVAAPAAAAASAPLATPPATNESVPKRRNRSATQGDGVLAAEILLHTEMKIEIPPAAWSKTAAARG